MKAIFTISEETNLLFDVPALQVFVATHQRKFAFSWWKGGFFRVPESCAHFPPESFDGLTVNAAAIVSVEMMGVNEV